MTTLYICAAATYPIATDSKLCSMTDQVLLIGISDVDEIIASSSMFEISNSDDRVPDVRFVYYMLNEIKALHLFFGRIEDCDKCPICFCFIVELPVEVLR